MMPRVRLICNRLERGMALSSNYVTLFECPTPRITQRVSLSYVTYRLATVRSAVALDGETRADSFVCRVRIFMS